jgi:hypothetical protein
LWAILLILVVTLSALFGMSSAGVAQSSDPQPQAQSPDDGPPPGGCNPIGVTVSGEIVFPMTCKEFIERYKAADRASSPAQVKPVTAEASKAPTAVEADKVPATAEVGKPPAAVEIDKNPTTAEANKAPAAVEADKTPTTAEASKAPVAAEIDKAPTTTGAGKASAAVEVDKAPASAQADKALADPAKPDEKDAKPAAAKAPADEAAPPVTKQAAAAPASVDTKPSAEPATTAAVSKRNRTRNQLAGSPGCTRFRTYDAASKTYRDFGGQRRSCP